MLLTLSAVPTTTTTTVAKAVAASGRDWFDWTQYVGVQLAWIIGGFGVILAGVLLYRSRPDCALGPAEFVRRGGGRVTITVHFHIVASGHWIVREQAVTFSANGVSLETVRIDTEPPRGVGERVGQYIYEMNEPDSDIEVYAVLRLKHKRRKVTYQGRVARRW